MLYTEDRHLSDANDEWEVLSSHAEESRDIRPMLRQRITIGGQYYIARCGPYIRR